MKRRFLTFFTIDNFFSFEECFPREKNKEIDGSPNLSKIT